MATHSSVLAWRIPGTEEPGGLPSMGSHRVGHDWRKLAAAVFSPGEGNGTPLQYSCLKNPMDGGSWKATVHGVTNSPTLLSDFTKETKWFRQNSGKSQSQASVLLLCSVTKWPPECCFSSPNFYWFSSSKLEPKDIPESLLDIEP